MPNVQTCVVSYRNSTSNHNLALSVITGSLVVSYRNSTSNHNNFEKRTGNFLLYLIEILHQTTTYTVGTSTFVVLYLIEILHQTTTLELEMSAQQRCILSKFYIKPQLLLLLVRFSFVVSYRNSTSNHNTIYGRPQYCCVVSYRNSTSNHNNTVERLIQQYVVSYRNSTSNHNFATYSVTPP